MHGFRVIVFAVAATVILSLPVSAQVPEVVALDTRQREPGRPIRGILWREIVRQALLIAARDELGLATRDRSLREFIDTKGIEPNALLNISPVIVWKNRFEYEISRGAADRREVLFQMKMPIPTHGIADLIAEIERHSRSQMPDALRKAGFSGAAKPYREHSAVPEEAQSFLDQWNSFAQFAAIRALHAEIREHGESAETLAALARAYANLGSLTEYLWSPAHKVFKARALLYAERYVAKSQASPMSVWSRAYVKALVGMHQLALEDIQQADAKQQTGESRPEWVGIIDAFCRFDFEKLDAACAQGDYQALALYLKLVGIDNSPLATQILTTAQQMAAIAPDCMRIFTFTSGVWQLSTSHVATTQALDYFPSALYARLAQFNDLPKSIREKIENAPEKDGEIEFRADLVRTLKRAGQAGDDRGEPSLASLGQLIEEFGFYHVFDYLYYLTYQRGAETSDAIDRFQPLFADHPMGGYIHCLDSDRTAAIEAARKIRPILLTHEFEIKETPLFHTYDWGGNLKGNERVWSDAFRNQDAVFSDFVVLSRVSPYDFKRHPEIMRAARDTCPNAPGTLAMSITYDWEFAKDHAAEWENRYKTSPWVLDALGRKYLELGRHDDAVRCFKLTIEAAPDVGVYRRLASVYWAQEQFDLWLKTLQEALQQPDFDLAHTDINIDISNYYYARQEWTNALAYAETAAQSGAGRAMLTAAACNEAIQNWERAEELVRWTSQRYPFHNLEWFMWCRRTGRGDARAALLHAQQYYESLGPDEVSETLERSGFYYLLIDKPDSAFEAFNEVVRRQKSKIDIAMHAALLADQLAKPAERDALLAVIVQSEESQKKDKTNLGYIRLAALFQKALAGEGGGMLPKETIQELGKAVPVEDAANIDYFAGTFLRNHNFKSDAATYLKRCAESRSKPNSSVALANDLLRRHPEAVGDHP